MAQIRKLEEEFNAVIKGTRFDPRYDPFYKLTNLSIPEDTYLIDDGVSNYRLYGFTRNFEDIRVLSQENFLIRLETKIPEFLGFCRGAVIPVSQRIKESPSILKIPGIVFTRDKRIYVREGQEKVYSLEEVLPSVLSSVGRMFCDDNGLYGYIYNDYINNKK